MKKIYSLELKRIFDIKWYSPIECQYVSKAYIDGYISCLKGHYPSPDIKIYEIRNKEKFLIEEIKGKGSLGIKKDIEVELLKDHPIILKWNRQKYGFGLIVFKTEGDKILCDSEAMGKDFVKDVLCSLVDKSELI